jgi:hypothetical protein
MGFRVPKVRVHAQPLTITAAPAQARHLGQGR